ncbi:MAG: aldo/keto reductase [Pseudonocardiaceae bacterium]
MRGSDSRVVLGLHRSAHRKDVLAHALSIGVDRLDTAYNYLRFASHRTLAATARDLLRRFAVSTKVGFFPTGLGAEHSLDPARLHQAVRESVDTLGVNAVKLGI